MGIYLKAKIDCTNCGHEFFSRIPKNKFLKCPKCRNETAKPKNPTGEWFIDYYYQGRRIAEAIGPNKKLAISALGKRKGEIAENRFFPEKRKENRTTFKELAEWYLDLSEIKAKKSYERDTYSIKALTEFFSNKMVTSIKPADIEDYRAKRKTQKTYNEKNFSIASINRELACLKRMFSLAVLNSKVENNPVKLVKSERENNERDRVLTRDEHERLLELAAPHIKPILITAYYTAMRKGEILNLTWDKVDFKNGFIRLSHEDTKSNEKRIIPLNKELTEMFKGVIRYLKEPHAFLLNGKPIKCIRESFKKAVKEAGIENFVFHDYRHTCITNWRRAGIDYLTIMRMSGHKTMSCFKRYNTIDEQDLKNAVGKVDTYLAAEK